MPPKNKAAAKGKAAAAAQAASAKDTKKPQKQQKEEEFVPAYLRDGLTQKDRDVVIDGYYMYTPTGKTELLKNASLRLVYGRHYGLIGQNGIGKSTLLKNIANYSIPGFPQHLRVIYVQQDEIPREDLDIPVWEYVVRSDEQKAYLEKRERELEDELESEDSERSFEEINDDLMIIYQRLEAIGAHTAEARARHILSGLQFTDEMINGPLRQLSGGWKMRVRLACALFVTPDILLLDEPTNHLDFPAVEWLAGFLRNYEPTLLVVSHDRGFLDQVMTDCIDFRDKTLTYYRGDYTTYLRVRAEKIRQHNHLWEKTEKKRAQLKQFIAEARQNALNDPNLAELAKTRQRILDALPVLEEIKEDKGISFNFPDPGSLDHAIIECKDMYYSYPGWVPRKLENPEEAKYTHMLNNISVNVDLTARIGILGANGAGKTTLINVLLGKLEPSAGYARLNSQARTKVFTQHHLDQLDDSKTPLEFLQERFPTEKEGYLRAYLGRFGFDKILAEQKIAKLSGGQKSRVAFAVLAFQKPHLIIMDEPTNHLDIETIESLIQALKNFKGGVIVISHDRYFLSQIAEEYWALNSIGVLKRFWDIDEAKEFSYRKISFVPDGAPLKKRPVERKEDVPEPVNEEDRRLEELAKALGGDDDDDLDHIDVDAISKLKSASAGASGKGAEKKTKSPEDDDDFVDPIAMAKEKYADSDSDDEKNEKKKDKQAKDKAAAKPKNNKPKDDDDDDDNKDEPSKSVSKSKSKGRKKWDDDDDDIGEIPVGHFDEKKAESLEKKKVKTHKGPVPDQAGDEDEEEEEHDNKPNKQEKKKKVPPRQEKRGRNR